MNVTTGWPSRGDSSMPCGAGRTRGSRRAAREVHCDSDAVPGSHERRELVASELTNRARGRVGGANQDERSGYHVVRVGEAAGKFASERVEQSSTTPCGLSWARGAVVPVVVRITASGAVRFVGDPQAASVTAARAAALRTIAASARLVMHRRYAHSAASVPEVASSRRCQALRAAAPGDGDLAA
jgi:hypothetical protein